jgi:hypothetical protein
MADQGRGGWCVVVVVVVVVVVAFSSRWRLAEAFLFNWQ